MGLRPGGGLTPFGGLGNTRNVAGSAAGPAATAAAAAGPAAAGANIFCGAFGAYGTVFLGELYGEGKQGAKENVLSLVEITGESRGCT